MILAGVFDLVVAAGRTKVVTHAFLLERRQYPYIASALLLLLCAFSSLRCA
jgi:hypothetical protein